MPLFYTFESLAMNFLPTAISSMLMQEVLIFVLYKTATQLSLRKRGVREPRTERSSFAVGVTPASGFEEAPRPSSCGALAPGPPRHLLPPKLTALCLENYPWHLGADSH